MVGGNSLVNIGDITKPANTLIEKISDAIGVMYEPSRIVRKAKAEAKAQEIMSLSDMNIKEIQQRALLRFIHEETKKQENIESIIESAIPKISSDAKSEDIENDWLIKFFDNAKSVSDKEMQLLWSELLVKETNNPGRFSRRSMNLLSDLDKQDAQLFTNLCKFGFMISSIAIVVFDSQHEIYNKHGINFNTLNHLDSLGLIQFEPLSGFARIKLPKEIVVTYFGRQIKIILPNDENNQLKFGQVLITKAGEQLSSICGSIPENEIMEHSIEHWRNQGLVVEKI